MGVISVPDFFKERKFPFLLTLSLLFVCQATTMASHSSNLECRMYEARYPEVGMAVMTEVKNITGMDAYVSLPEYNNIEGIILFRQLSIRQIPSDTMSHFIGLTTPAEVYRVDKEKGYIDLSRRIIPDENIRACEERYNSVWPPRLWASIWRSCTSTLVGHYTGSMVMLLRLSKSLYLILIRSLAPSQVRSKRLALMDKRSLRWFLLHQRKLKNLW